MNPEKAKPPPEPTSSRAEIKTGDGTLNQSQPHLGEDDRNQRRSKGKREAEERKRLRCRCLRSPDTGASPENSYRRPREEG
ncbi:hypothetical protein N665_0312s0008 [Sinapis alba]|nr:hypothetical protein N665_0312s0008 [Sinapis alba]